MRPKITFEVGAQDNPDICCDGFALDFCPLLHGAGVDEHGEGKLR